MSGFLYLDALRIGVFLYLLGIFMVILFFHRRHAGKKEIIDSRNTRWIHTGLNVSVFSNFAIYLLANPQPVFAPLGFTLMTVGLLINIYGRHSLGVHYSRFVEIHKHQQYINTGIYRYFSHPIYMAELLLFFGACLIFNLWIQWLLFFVFAFLLYKKVSLEHDLLKKHFPEAYHCYWLDWMSRHKNQKLKGPKAAAPNLYEQRPKSSP